MPKAFPQAPNQESARPADPAGSSHTAYSIPLSCRDRLPSGWRKPGGLVAAGVAVAAGLLLALAIPANAQSSREEKLEHLTIVNARFLDSEDGYPLPPNSSFYPGEHVYVTFNVGGFHVTEYEYKMKISYRIDFLGPRGEPFSNSEAGVIDQEIYAQDDKWKPIIRTGPRIPFHAEAGTYKIQLYAKDEFRPQEESRQELTFEVLGKEIGDVEKLTVRNFAFLQSEGGEPLETPSYRPGDTLWGAFYITGFELRQNNSYEVDSRLQVIDPDGEVMYAFAPQEEEGESYYPRRWLPGRFRVDLDKDIPGGEYVLVLSVRDNLGNQESETRHPFQIR